MVMDKPPSNFFNLFSQILKVTCLLFCFIFFSFFYFSCSNTAPDISNVNAKVIYDYENNADRPVQKLSIFLQMKSEVRRIEQINIYHKETGYRWIIKSPLIFETNSNQYAGYTNCQVAGILNEIPEGDYQVFYIDSQGRETFSNFSISKNENSIQNTKKIESYLASDETNLMLAVYDKDSKLISYSKPESKFEINKENQTYNGEIIFKTFSEASFFRLIFETKEKVYMLPKVFKEEKTDSKN